jgi:hypothetical protein
MARIKVTLLRDDRTPLVVKGREQSHVYVEGEGRFAEGDCPACEAASHTDGGDVMLFRAEDLDGEHAGRVREYRTERVAPGLAAFLCAEDDGTDGDKP